jgi:hypothetical protein
VGHALRVSVTASNSAGAAAALSGATSVIAAAQAPLNTSAPSISGTARDGQRLTAAPGSWRGVQPVRYAYQWTRCDAKGNACASIGGAVAQSYVLTGADVGHALRVVVTATNADGTGRAISGASAVVAAKGTAPALTSPPAISGRALQGVTLSTSNGRWNGTAPLRFRYSWQRCDAQGGNCVEIGGATNTRYLLTGSDVGHTVRTAVTASNSAGAITAYSAATSPVAPRTPTSVAPPTISGTARAGQTLTAGTGSWAGVGPLAYYYQWARCDTQGLNCFPIAGALGQTYTLTLTDVGHALIVQVKAQNTYGPGYANSRPTAVVAAAGVISLRATQRLITYGAFTRLSGIVPAGQAGDEVTIVATPVGKTIGRRTIAVRLTTGGAFALAVQPKVQTIYQVQVAGSSSAAQTVYVRPRIRLARLSRNAVTVLVYETNSLIRHTAHVQYWSADRGRWVTLSRRAVLRSTALVRRPTIVTRASYRVHTLPKGTRLRISLTAGQAGPGYLGATSNVIRL